MKLIFFSFILLFVCTLQINKIKAQETNDNHNFSKYEINASFSPVISNLHSNVFGSEEKSKLGYIGSVDFTFNIKQTGKILFGIALGANYSNYSTDRNSGYKESVNTTDLDNEPIQITEQADLIEKQIISVIGVQALFKINYLFNEKVQIYFHTGAEYTIPVKKTYSSEGRYSRTGYYSQYNCLITNIEESGSFYNFPENKPANSSGNLDVKNGINLLASSGIKYYLNKRLGLFGGFKFVYGLTDINHSKSENFELMTDNKFNSLMERKDQIKYISFGLQFGISVGF